VFPFVDTLFRLMTLVEQSPQVVASGRRTTAEKSKEAESKICSS
jgi:hypothetical protein